MRRLLPSLALLLLGVRAAAAQAEDEGAEAGVPMDRQTIEELLHSAQTEIASKMPSTTRESPGIVTVVTREEILRTGARDLLDILRNVPGFSVGVDVEGVVSIGVRGNWGHEGKVLLLVDGVEMNELLYSTLQLGHRLPVAAIERVEIIRGPGSAVYGGFAELAVIHVITRSATDLRGGSASIAMGATRAGLLRSDTTVYAGQAFDGGSVSASLFFGQGNRSDRPYTDYAGGVAQLADGSAVDPMLVDVGLTLHGLKGRFIYDGYRITTQDGFGDVLPETKESFGGLYGSLAYPLRLSDTVTVTPRVDYTWQRPWRVTDPASPLFYMKTVQRLRGQVSASWDALERLNLLLGVEGYLDHAVLDDLTISGTQTDFKGADSVSYQDLAFIAQASLRHAIANVTLGARLELHSEVGSSIAPRLALTRVFDKFHVKLLVASAFRAPGIENINLAATSLSPEQTTVFELEAGYQLGAHWFAAANAFDITIHDPIIYFYDPVTLAEGYANFTQTGSRGVEAELRWKDERGFANLSASWATAADKNQVAAYEVPGSTTRVLGFPELKVALSGSVRLWRGLSAGGSAAFMSARAAYTAADLVTDLDPSLAVDLHLLWRNLGLRGFDVSLGVYNVLDQDIAFIQPYSGGHPPIPGPTAELAARMSYTVPF